MGAHHSKDHDHGERRRRKKKSGATLTTNTYPSDTNSIDSSTVNDPPASPPVPIPTSQQPTVTYDATTGDSNNHSTQKYSPFYRRTTSTGHVPITNVTHTSVKPVRHQVVLSDQVMPLSSLISISRHLRSNSESTKEGELKQHLSSSSSSSNTSINKRRFNFHSQKQPQKQQYDTDIASDDGESRTNVSSTKSAIYSNSVNSSSSGITSPVPPGFWNRRLSLNDDTIKEQSSPTSISTFDRTKANTHRNSISNSNISTSSNQNGPVVFDATINAADPLPSPSLSSSPRSQHDQRHQDQPLQLLKSAWIYDYGHEKEYNRQLRQHYVLKQVFGKNIIVNLEESPQTILDSACGIGVWTWETSQQYSNCDVIGIDINLPDHHSGPWGSSTPSVPSTKETNNEGATFVNSGKNISFLHGDILQQLPFEDQHFDFIHQREAGSFIPLDYWETLLHEFNRVLKVGGQIQLVEHDILFKNPGPVLTMINEWYRIAADGLGVRTGFIDVLEEKLVSAGFDQVQVFEYDIPVGEWSDDPVRKQHGFLYKEQIKALFKSVQRWWLTETGITQQEYERVCSDAMGEFDDYNSSVLWKIVTGRKPPSPS